MDRFVADRIREYALRILVIHENHKLIPCKTWVFLCQRNGIKAVIPAPNSAHPVLGHEHYGSGHVTSRFDDTGPIDVGGKRSRFIIGGRNTRHQFSPMPEFLLYPLSAVIEIFRVVPCSPYALKGVNGAFKCLCI